MEKLQRLKMDIVVESFPYLSAKRRFSEFLNEIIENLADSYVVTDLEGKIVYYNSGSKQLFGYEPQEVLGQHITILGVKKPNVIKMIREGKIFKGELLHTRKNGEKFYSYVVCVPLKDKSGNPVAMLGVAKDVTSEKEMKKLKDLNEKIISSVNEGIQMLNKEGIITFVNKKFQEIVGYSEEELIGRDFTFLLPKDSPLISFKENFSKNALNKPKDTFETVFIKRNRQKIPVIASISIIDDNDSNQGMIISIADISEIETLKQELSHVEKMSILGQLASEIAHEINSPLTSLLLGLEILTEKIEKETLTKREILSEIKKMENDVQKCTRLTERLLRFSRKTRKSKKIFNLINIVEESLLMLKHSFDIEGICLNVIYKDQFLPIEGNPNEIQQVVLNLLKNAKDACLEVRDSKRVVTLKAYKTFENQSMHAILEVLDTGKGINKRFINRIFEPFFTTKKNGVGIGLSVSKRIIQEHGGSIAVTNLKPRGAMFKVMLPLFR